MKKSILIFLQVFLMFISGSMFSQTGFDWLTPGGIFDTVHDSRGKKYLLKDIRLDSPVPFDTTLSSEAHQSLSSAIGFTYNAGYFDIYFQNGMQVNGNSSSTFITATQSVVCVVLKSLSDFIITNSLTATGAPHVNIYVSSTPIPFGAVAKAGAVYVLPSQPNNPNQGFIDNQVQKMLLTSIDPYTNVPVIFNYFNNSPAGFFHGFITLNSVNIGNPLNVSLTTPPGAGENDLFSYLMHEMGHVLGIQSAITSNGMSFFSASINNNSYTRFDSKLCTATNQPLLGSSTTSCTSNLTFTSALTVISPSTTGCVTDISTCSTSVKYLGSAITVTVYTPNCFEQSSSLMHFEDMCGPTTNPNGCTPSPPPPGYNNLYYNMSERNMLGICGYKRYYQKEERLVLCDLGYNVSSSLTTLSAILQNTATNIVNYTTSCSPSVVVGLNDGLANGVYSYTTTSNSFSIPTASLLLNDLPSSGLSVSCVEIVYTNAMTLHFAAVSGSLLVVTGVTGSGLAVVKYTPVNSSGVFGNATYVFVYFLSNGCNPANYCNMIQNGGFENSSGIGCGRIGISPTINSQLNCWEEYPSGIPSASLYVRGCSGTTFNLTSNTLGTGTVAINSFNGIPNNKLVALTYTNGVGASAIKNNLSGPIIPGTSYNISFWALNYPGSITGVNTNYLSKSVVITVACHTVFPFVPSGNFPFGLYTIAQFTIPAGTNWKNYSATIQTPTTQVNHSSLIIGIDEPQTSSIAGWTSGMTAFCFLDEISLLSTYYPTFTIPTTTICGNQSIIDLNQYVSSGSSDFYGPQVTFTNSLYNFNQNNTLSPGDYPIMATTTLGACTYSSYALVSVSTNTNLMTLVPAILCSGAQTLNLGSLVTNQSFTPAAVFLVNSVTTTPVYSFTPPAVYTVTAVNSSSYLCNSTGSTVVMNYTTPIPPTLSINGATTTNSTVCSGHLASLMANSTPGNPNYLWNPGNLTGTTQNINPTVSTIYTVSVFNYSVCSVTQTLMITVDYSCCTTTSISATSSSICSGITLGSATLTGVNATSYTWQPSNSTNTSIVVSPTVTTVYSLTGYSPTCPPTYYTVIVYNNSIPVPTITSSSSTVCPGGAASVVFTVNPSTFNYTCQPGNLTGNTFTVGLASSTEYTITTGTPSCYNTKTINITTSGLNCDCSANCQASLVGTLNASPATNSVYCVTGNLFITPTYGPITFSNSVFKIAPGATIVVTGTLNIEGSRLYACDNMWQGIEVKSNGALRISTSQSATNLIEDALIAVHVKELAYPHDFAGVNGQRILSIEGATFNRSNIGIKIESLPMNTSTNNPCEITNCLFTSRSIAAAGATVWPFTTNVKNSNNSGANPLQTPWMDNTTYPSLKMKTPMNSDYPSNGIVLVKIGNSVGSSTPSVFSYTSMLIGTTGSLKFNMFDNLYNGINITHGNVKIINAIFQNPKGKCRNSMTDPPTCDIGGTGIVAYSPWTDDSPFRNSIEVVPAIFGTLSYSNYFYDMTTAVDIHDYLYTDVSKNKFYSSSNSYPQNPWYTFNTSPPNFGNLGVSMRANSFQYLFVKQNEMYNIRNGILFTVTQGGSDFTPGGTYGRYIGQALIQNNFLALHPSTPTGNEYINIGIDLEDPITTPGYTPYVTSISAVTPSIAISSNTIVNAHNGISVNSFYGTPVNILSNQISLKNEPNTVVTNQTQNGIASNQAQSTRIHLNSVAGPGISSVHFNLSSIYASMNTLLSVRCNTTSGAGKGLNFNHTQSISQYGFDDNTMQDELLGYLLDNNGKFTTGSGTIAIGSSSWPTNNSWLGSWGTTTTQPYKTATDHGTNAANGKLFVVYGNSTYDSDGNGFTGSTFQYYRYFHTGSGPITLLSATTSLTGCRIGQEGSIWNVKSSGGHWNDLDSSALTLFENIIQDGIISPNDMTDDEYIAKTLVYRTLRLAPELSSSSTLLNEFYTSCNTVGNSIKVFCDVENSLTDYDFSAAETALAGVSPAKGIEGNYKSFYDLYMKSRNTGFSSSDSSSLSDLASLCPFVDGSVIYQARALYNDFYSTFKSYSDECLSEGGDRNGNTNVASKSAQVVIKSLLYPNPNEGNFTLKFNVKVEKQQVEIGIFDLTGRTILKELKVVDENNSLLVKTNLLNGTYLIKVNLLNGTYDMHRLIITK